MMNEISPKLDRIIQDLRSSRGTTNDKLPMSFKNPDILTHTEQLISSASTVIGQGSTVWGGSEIGFSRSSEAGKSLDKASKLHIEEWIPQLTITEEEGSQASEPKPLTAASETVVEETGVDVEEIEYSDSDGDEDYDFAQKCFERGENCFSTDEHSKAVEFFRAGLKRANRLSFERQNRLELRNAKRELALSLLYEGNLAESEEIFQTLARGSTGDKKSVGVALHASSGMAQVCLCRRSFIEAEDWCKKIRVGWRRAVGTGHPLYIDSLRLTAFLYELRGDTADASAYEDLAKEAKVMVDEDYKMTKLLGFTADQSRDLVRKYHQAYPAPEGQHNMSLREELGLDSREELGRDLRSSQVAQIEEIETPKTADRRDLKSQTSNDAVKPLPEVSICDLGLSPLSETIMAAKDTSLLTKRPSMVSESATSSTSQVPLSNSRLESRSESIVSSEALSLSSENHQGDSNTFTRRLRDGRTQSAMLSAARKGDVAALEKLLSKGAPVEATNGKGETPLCLAAIGGHIAAIETLLRHGAMIEVRTKKGCTPLLCAKENVARSRIGVMRTLLEARANIDAKDEYGDTALSNVVGLSRPDLVKALLEFKPSLETKNNTGKTVLLRAVDFSAISCAKPLLETVKLLLDAGANVKAIDDKNQTAVLIAIKAIALRTGFGAEYWHDYFLLIQLLCASGADATFQSIKGASPLSATSQIKDEALRDAVRKVLKRYGAT